MPAAAGGIPGGTALRHAAVFDMTKVVDVLVAAGAGVILVGIADDKSPVRLLAVGVEVDDAFQDVDDPYGWPAASYSSAGRAVAGRHTADVGSLTADERASSCSAAAALCAATLSICLNREGTATRQAIEPTAVHRAGE